MGGSIGTLFPLRFRLWLGRKLYRPFTDKVVRVSRNRLIKGPCDPPEIEAMQYIIKNTTIPIPKIYAIHTTQCHLLFIEMEYIHGEHLGIAWGREGRLSQDQKKVIIADIQKYVSILRELQPPAENLVASALQNPAYDGRIGSRFFGPFNHSDFHTLLRNFLPEQGTSMIFGEEVAKVHSASYRTCFTHGDLVPRNIIVKDGRVAAIIDWGYSGWYPEYWEYTKAHYDFFPKADWLESFRQAVPSYDAELAAEQVLWERCLDPGTPATYHREGVVRRTPGSRPSVEWEQARAGCHTKDIWSIALKSYRYRDRYS
ncbi:chitinase 18-4 [Cordyceps javanica]|uniref:Chitinase 18-4 n=1 Tax=Cordyceps javanica TaxID=43265 RepID=A0A545UQV2_9HYPO|nr:chitinase 18-4 [Cordyceps javanica]